MSRLIPFLESEAPPLSEEMRIRLSYDSLSPELQRVVDIAYSRGRLYRVSWVIEILIVQNGVDDILLLMPRKRGVGICAAIVRWNHHLAYWISDPRSEEETRFLESLRRYSLRHAD